jgi:hypothetical protein
MNVAIEAVKKIQAEKLKELEDAIANKAYKKDKDAHTVLAGRILAALVANPAIVEDDLSYEEMARRASEQANWLVGYIDEHWEWPAGP